ncbi:hypothetical protein TRFO_07628 [Tritrichomonas foetus]|uniref:Uncharacterized protein n=1 Tax=Tritrichomonas foetus TaxID=1144522 RepID=A0A1J4JQD5_9EUKA|nr:hypothetical protein TRFO_07628 [Tritrichomonas foetus]|eukprot:OHT01375.1 hypothetical protein TRFO_07628 [Tritrichomonas foetus]
MNQKLNSIIHQLKAKQPIPIIGALSEIEEMKKNQLKFNEITPEMVDVLFPLLIPLLIHNNYKIRILAYKLTSYFLTDFRDYIYNSINAFPNVITSLASVNKKVLKHAKICAEAILNLEDPIKWWPEIESKLERSRSKVQKYTILDLLVDHADEMYFCDAVNQNIIPVQVICKLLDDSDIKIQKKAMQILDLVEKTELNSSLRAAEDQFKIVHPDPNPYVDLNQIHVEPRKPRNRATSPHKDDIKNCENKASSSNISLSNAKTSNAKQSSKIYGTSQSSFKLNQSRNSILSNIENKTLGSPSSKASEISLSASSQSSKASQSSIASQSSRASQLSVASQSSVASHSSVASQSSAASHSSVASQSSAASQMSRASQASKMSQLTQSSKSSQKSANYHSRSRASSIAKEVEQAPKPKTFKPAKPLKETVGELPTQQTNQMTFRLRDLSMMQLVQKYTFLQELDKIITQPGKLQYPPDQIIDCILTAAFPICRQVSPLLSKILSELLPQNPELISVFAHDIIKFVLLGIRFLQDPSPFQILTDTLFLESDPSEIVDTAVTIANSEKRSLHIESYFIPLFFGSEPVILQKQALFNFLCHLVHRAYPDSVRIADRKPEYLNDVSRILSSIATNQRVLYQEFMDIQTLDAQKILEKFLISDQQSATREYKIEQGILNLDDPMETLNNELKKGNKSNLILIADALEQLDLASHRRVESVFRDIIKFFSVLSQGKVQRHTNEIKRICNSHFDAPQLLSIIETPDFVPDLIFGLSIFVWYCPKTTLEACNCFYYPLYSIFKRASGEIREQVILIEMAISRVTKRSIIDLDFIPDAHKKLILKLEKQFINQ